MRNPVISYRAAWRIVFCLIMIGGLCWWIPPQKARAATITVTSPHDSGPGTLRQAVLDASSGDKITFDASLGGALITLSSEILIDKNLTIDGIDGELLITISGGFTTRMFHVSPGVTLTMFYLNFINGNAVDGGAFYNEGTLQLLYSKVDGNYASGNGGAIYTLDLVNISESTISNNDAGGDGGALYHAGDDDSLNLHYNAWHDNSAGGDGGAIYLSAGNTTSTNNNTFYNNSAVGSGGGIDGHGMVMIKNNTFSDNSAASGGGIKIESGGTSVMWNNIIANSVSGGDCVNEGLPPYENVNNLVEDGSCGAALSGDPVLRPFTENGGRTKTMAPDTGSPAVDAGDDTTCAPIDQRGVSRPHGWYCDIGAFETAHVLEVNNHHDPGDGFCTWVNCTLREAIMVAASGDTITFPPNWHGVLVTLTDVLEIEKDLTIDGGSLDPRVRISGDDTVQVFQNFGHDLTLHNLEISNGRAQFGGGVQNIGGHLTITGCELKDNSATEDGGAINSFGVLNITDTTFGTNSADEDGGAIFNYSQVFVTGSTFYGNAADGDGGGVFNLDGSVVVANSTFDGNHADEYGGGIHNYQGNLNVSNSTFSGNSALLEGGAINTDDINHLTLKNSILADSTSGGDCVLDPGTMYFNYTNLIEDGSCSPAFSGDPLLLPLADNGGPTETMALDSGSPALDAGDDGQCESVDQRGVSRPQGDHCDIGAYEVEVILRAPLADFDGDGDTDISVFRPSNGNWYVKGMSPVSWALAGDLPEPGDYDGDGTTDIAVYRPSNGNWYVKGQGYTNWGFPGDIPLQADYDGDGADEIAVLRPSNHKWYIQGMGNFSWHQTGDIPVPCDYDGDGADEIAVFRPSNNNWYVKGMSPVSWALSGDIPVPADYDGDGTCDIAVYRPSLGNWYVKGQGYTNWGYPDDIPVPGDYDGDGADEIAVLRPSNGKWYIQGMGNFSWYLSGDFPLPVRDTNADGDVYE